MVLIDGKRTLSLDAGACVGCVLQLPIQCTLAGLEVGGDPQMLPEGQGSSFIPSPLNLFGARASSKVFRNQP